MLTFQWLIQQRSHILPDYAIFLIRFTVFAVFHSLLATKSVKALAVGINGREPRFYRLSYNLISLLMFGWVMASWRNSAVLYYAPGVWSLLLYLGQLMIILMILSCLHQTGLSTFLGLGPAEDESSDQLITTGFYSFVRHPLYFLSTLFLLLNPVMTLQWLLLTVFTVIYFIIGALIEEHRLLEQYGLRYLSYQQEVPFIIPKPERFKRPTNV